jgi:hypothetical protein
MIYLDNVKQQHDCYMKSILAFNFVAVPNESLELGV